MRKGRIHCCRYSDDQIAEFPEIKIFPENGKRAKNIKPLRAILVVEPREGHDRRETDCTVSILFVNRREEIVASVDFSEMLSIEAGSIFVSLSAVLQNVKTASEVREMIRKCLSHHVARSARITLCQPCECVIGDNDERRFLHIHYGGYEASLTAPDIL